MLVRVGDRDIQIPKSTVLSLLGVYIDQGPAGRDRKAFLEKTFRAADLVATVVITEESRRRLAGEEIPRLRRAPRRARYVRVLRTLLSRYRGAENARTAILSGKSRVLVPEPEPEPDRPPADEQLEFTLDSVFGPICNHCQQPTENGDSVCLECARELTRGSYHGTPGMGPNLGEGS